MSDPKTGTNFCPECQGTGQVSIPTDKHGQPDWLHGEHRGTFGDCQECEGTGEVDEDE